MSWLPRMGLSVMAGNSGWIHAVDGACVYVCVRVCVCVCVRVCMCVWCEGRKGGGWKEMCTCVYEVVCASVDVSREGRSDSLFFGH